MLPKQLMFTVGLIDQITKPIAKISKQFSGLASNYQAGTMKMATGMAGIAGAGYALSNAMQPALDIDRALGEVKSLGVRDDALKQLTDTAYDFSLKYGVAADEFIRSGYDIQSSIDGINGKDLSAFTKSSNLLAKATKADGATITDYMGTMFGIFKGQANKMGQTKWVEQMTGMTATAVKIFKTDGKKMADAFGALGGDAGLAPIQEQMAILGTLQSTMSGSESATKYKAFLTGAGKAQKALGMSFEDSQGKLLPTLDILRKLQGRFGDLSKSADQLEITKAFGSDLATSTIRLLLKDVNGLDKSINNLGKVKGMEQAEKMAAAMTQQTDRLSASWYVVRAAFGSAILPVFNSMASWLANVGRDLVSFTEKHPTLTKYLGYTAVALLGMVAAGGLFTIMVGASTMAMTTWKALMVVASAVGSGYSTVLTFMQTRMSGLSKATTLSTLTSGLWTKAVYAKNLAVSMFTGSIKKAKFAFLGFNMMAQASGGILPMLGGAIMTATSATWGFVASLAAAAWPITLIIAAIVGVAVAVYKYWQPIKAFFGGFWDGLTEGFAPVGEVFSALFESFSFLGDIFSWLGEQVGFSSTELAGFSEAGKSFGGIIASVFNALLWPIKQFINLLSGGINLVKDITGAVADFFGFGDDKTIKAELTNKQVLALPENGAPMPTVIPSNVISMPLAKETQQAQQTKAAYNNVVPLKQPIVPAALTAQVQQNTVVPESLKTISTVNKHQDKTNNLLEIPALKLERTKVQPSFVSNNNSNRNEQNTDNKKQVFIDNLTMKSDDVNQSFDQLMELAG